MGRDIPVIDLEEPPLQAEIMIKSSMTLSLILHRFMSAIADSSSRSLHHLLAATTLHDKDILVAHRCLCSKVSGGVQGIGMPYALISTEVSPLLNFLSAAFAGF